MGGQSEPTVLVGIKHLPGSAPLLREAVRVAAQLGAHLIIAMVLPRLTPVLADSCVALLDVEGAAADDMAAQVLPELVEQLVGCPVSWELATLTGNPVTQLASVAHSRNASVIVVGEPCRGWRHRVRRLLTGSVPALLRNPRTWLVVVPTEPHLARA